MIEQPEPHKVAVDELILWEDNPRNSDVDTIGKSMSRFGMNSTPAYRNEETGGETFKIVYGGNHRVKAARAAGLEYLWMINLDHLTKEEAQMFGLADNRTTDIAAYDKEKYAQLIADANQIDKDLLRDFKFGDDEIEQHISGLPYVDEGIIPDSRDPKEIDLDGFEFENTCPKCDYKW